MSKIGDIIISGFVGFFISSYVARPYLDVIKMSLINKGDSLSHADLVYNVLYYTCAGAVMCLIYLLLWIAQVVLKLNHVSRGE